MSFSLGKQSPAGQSPERLLNPLGHVRLILEDSTGATGSSEAFGCAGDRLSVRWLDKRPGRPKGLKLRELVALIAQAREIYLEDPDFDDPFDKWWRCHKSIMDAGRASGQESLTSSFASALMERAMVDAVCRLRARPIVSALHDGTLGFQPERIAPELKGFDFARHLPRRPVTRFHIRHTVGLSDPLTARDLPDAKRVNDGLPETLEEYIREDGLTFFKVKVSGDPPRDLERLAKLWEVLPKDPSTAVTLDANEAYSDLDSFARFIESLQNDLMGLFQHILYIEQPLPRALTLDPATRIAIRRIARSKPLLIDEADGELDAYRRAYAIGYAGTSHKNCKGFFKSLVNRTLVAYHRAKEEPGFLSGEDLQNLPIVPLHQDFVSLGILGLTHCERNGHHYNYGLSMLSEKDKASVAKHHRDLYVKRGDEWFLNIQDGRIDCASLQCIGFGVRDEPDWPSMMDMMAWVRKRYPE